MICGEQSPSSQEKMSSSEPSLHEYDELQCLYKTGLMGPFPYEDCRKLAAPSGFIPDLDLYWSGIAGIASRGRRLLELEQNKRAEFVPRLKRSFFEAHPRYQRLQAAITAENTPHLFRDMTYYEEARLRALKLLSEG